MRRAHNDRSKTGSRGALAASFKRQCDPATAKRKQHNAKNSAHHNRPAHKNAHGEYLTCCIPPS